MRHGITKASVWLTTMIGVAVVASCHSAPFELVDQGAIGPLTSGDEARLTVGSGFDASWSEDGKAILYRARPRPAFPGDLRAANGRILDSLDVCPIVLPAGGGSALLQACDQRQKQADSINFIVTAALNANGQLLYVESIAPNSRQPGTNATDFPIFYHTGLYLADTARLYNPRRLLTLFYEATGHAVVPASAVNWLEQIRWNGANRFVALGKNLDPDSTFTPLGVVRGTIAGDSAVLELVPNTSAIDLYAVTRSGTILAFRSGPRSVSAMPLAGGPVTLLGTLPVAANRSILDISCQATQCVVLTSENDGLIRSRLWLIPSTGGEPALLKSYNHPMTSARIAPSGHNAVAIEGGVLYLLANVLP